MAWLRVLCAAALVAAAVAQDCASRESFSVEENKCLCRPGLVRAKGGGCVTEPQVGAGGTADRSRLVLSGDALVFQQWDDASSALQSTDMAAALTSVAGKADAAALAALSDTVDGLVTATAALQPLSDANSGDCTAARANRLRYHVSYRRVEICATALREDDWYWHPLGAPPGCWWADGAGVCQRCHRGLVLSGGWCLEPADQLHLTFENDLADLSNSGRDGTLVGGNKNGETNLLEGDDAPEGDYALDLDGQDMYVQLPAFSFGGAFTLCAYVKFNSFNTYSRVIDFSNGPDADNIIIGHVGDGPNLVFEVWQGNEKKGIYSDNFWAAANGAFVHACFSVNANGDMKAYRNGDLVASGPAWAPIAKVRTQNYVGASGFPADGKTHGSFDDVRLYSAVLTDEAVRQLACGWEYAACDGLLGHWRFERDGHDSSHSRWNAEIVNAHPLNEWSRSYVEGSYALRFDGTENGDAANYAQLPPRMLGGPMSVCAAVYFNAFPGWSRVIDFGDGAAMNNILIAQEAGNRNIVWEIYQGGQAMSIKVPDGWWRADGAVAHVCCTVDQNGQMRIFVNGRKLAEGPGQVPPMLKRANMYIGRSNWNDASLDGTIDDLRIWERALTETEVQQVHCRSRNSTLDCVGLLGYYTMDGDALDRSGSGWHGDVVRGSATGSIFTDADPDTGDQALQLRGTDTYIHLRPRIMGGAFSVCADVQLTEIQNWGRLIDFGNGPNADNIVIANIGGTPNLAVHLLDGATRIGTLEINGFWSQARAALTPVCFTASDEGVLKAYINGAVAGQAVNQQVPPIKLRNNNFIGESNWAPDESSHALIDNVRIYDYALSDAEVVTLAQKM